MTTNNRLKIAKESAVLGMITALLTGGKAVLSFLPNIEIVSFMIIMLSVFLGFKMLLPVFAFVLLEGVMYGFGVWWIGYLYIWPLLCVLSCIVGKSADRFSLSVLSSLFGLFFGLLSSPPYIFIGTANPGIKYAVSWWISGIPFDLIHGIGNLAVMLLLYNPVNRVLTLVSGEHGSKLR